MFDALSNERWKNRSTFSVEEAGCQILGLSKCSAYAAASRGDIPTVRIGRRLLVPRIALEKLLAVPPKPAAKIDAVRLANELSFICEDQNGPMVHVEFDRSEVVFLISLLEESNA